MSKKLVVDQDKCIGCNTCPLIAPENFEIDTTTYKAIVKNQPADFSSSDITTAISSCPVGAISIVEE